VILVFPVVFFSLKVFVLPPEGGSYGSGFCGFRLQAEERSLMSEALRSRTEMSDVNDRSAGAARRSA
jgi:hypothetical protein